MVEWQTTRAGFSVNGIGNHGRLCLHLPSTTPPPTPRPSRPPPSSQSTASIKSQIYGLTFSRKYRILLSLLAPSSPPPPLPPSSSPPPLPPSHPLLLNDELFLKE